MYSGEMYYTCRMGERPLPGAKVWEKYSDFKQDESYAITCRPPSKIIRPWLLQDSSPQCPDGTVCGSPLDFGLSLIDDGIYSNEAIHFGVSGYDTITQAFVTIF